MSNKIRVPLLPESVSDATIAIWIKKIGDKVEEGDILLELETDKIILEVTAPASGVLAEIIYQQDAVVTSGEVIGLIGVESTLEEERKVVNDERIEESVVENQLGNRVESIDLATRVEKKIEVTEGMSERMNEEEKVQQEAQNNSPVEIQQEILQELEQIQNDVPEATEENLTIIEEQVPIEIPVERNNEVRDDEIVLDSEENTSEETPVVSLFGSPSVRKAMAENEIQASEITGSGKKGKILKQDIEQHLQQFNKNTVEQVEEKKRVEDQPVEDKAIVDEAMADQAMTTPLIQQDESNKDEVSDMDETIKTNNNNEVEAVNHPQAISDLPVVTQSSPVKVTTDVSINENPLERRVPMTRLRARIAERLVEAQQTAAILTTFNDVDLSEIIRLRKIYRERFERVHGIKLGFMSFFVKAATEALKRYPEVNARIDGQDIVYQGKYDIGVAVSTERGLVVPIVRDTNTLGHAEIEKKIHDFAHRARHNQLELNELTGGTFSITNGGVFGSMLSTPIINPPQSAILGMHKIEDRPVAINGEVVIRPMMYLALSYDHRLIDGKTAVSFLVKIKELLEDPASLFLEL
jgi:2-oxoglutarate dehydrogenase E2 component (dihydrolipoamide succinyltransferase)